MYQERLSSLSVLSIENDFAKDIDFEEAIHIRESTKTNILTDWSFRFGSIFVQNVRTF